MLDTEELIVSDIIDKDHLYYASDKSHFWINGVVSEHVPHVTLLYGLLRTGPEMKKHVDAVLKDWELEAITINEVTYFESKLADEPYYCLIAKVDPKDLKEANDLLRMLPHVNTYPDYEPHITLAYIKKDETLRDTYVDLLNTRFKGQSVAPKGINYGGNKEA